MIRINLTRIIRGTRDKNDNSLQDLKDNFQRLKENNEIQNRDDVKSKIDEVIKDIDNC